MIIHLLSTIRRAVFRILGPRRWSSSSGKLLLRMLGARIGSGVRCNGWYVTWPHKINIGKCCTIEHNVYFKFDGPYVAGSAIDIGSHVFVGAGTEFNIVSRIEIGDDSLIASGCHFIDHDHGLVVGQNFRSQSCASSPIRIGRDVWIGARAVILKGVRIEDGAVIGAGSVVTRTVPSNEIWAGCPARKIGVRTSAV